MSLSALDTAIAAIKSTTSGKVEYNANSLATVLTQIRSLLADRIIRVADVTELQAVDPAETGNVYVAGAGLFLHSDDAYDVSIPNSYPDTGGGSWIKESVESLDTIIGIDKSTFTDGDALIYVGGSTQKVEGHVPSAVNVGYDNVTAKPKLLFLDSNKTFQQQGATAQVGNNNLVIFNTTIPNLTLVDNNIVLSNDASLKSGNPAFTLANSVLLGNPGLVDLITSGNVSNIIAIGTGGQLSFSKDEDGRVHIGVVAGVTTKDNTLWGTVRATGQLTVDSGGLTITLGGLTVAAGGANITGNVTVVGDVAAANAGFSGNLGVAGNILAANIGSGSTILSSASRILAVNRLSFPTASVHADQAAAVAAGVAVGDFYVTATGEVRMRY